MKFQINFISITNLIYWEAKEQFYSIDKVICCVLLVTENYSFFFDKNSLKANRDQS